MKKTVLTMMILACSFVNTAANASLITIDTRTITNGINNTDFLSSWNKQTSSINSASLDEFTMHQSGNNSISHLKLNFSNVLTATWGFQAGLDAAYGAAIYLDNVLLTNRTDDLWWGYNWGSADVVASIGNIITPGAHSLSIYWAEACCNGASSMQFSVDRSTWSPLSTKNINAVASVSEPTSFLLFSLALMGFVVNRRRLSK